ncbi:MAG: cupin domain-containing protein, partial [Myxococcota bacterium]
MGPRPDALSSALEPLRISGSVVLHHSYAAPWAVDVPAADALVGLAGGERDARVVPFHLVERGGVVLETRSRRLHLGPGELVACFGGHAHRLGQGDRPRPMSLVDVLAGAARPADGDDTRLLCGVFVLRDTALHPLLAALPELLAATTTDDELERVARTLQRELRTGGNGSAYLVDRALETLCASLVRQHLARTP